MVLSGEPVDANEALRIGLVTRVWREVDFAGEWRAYAASVATGATEAYALTKEGLNASWEQDLATFLETEAGLQDRAGRTGDYAEGVRAFLGKRPARFTGS
jgi:2-(1,2-epoxy-1,2-dihydrophenyl)acetyl-CoA isomerase